LSEKKMRPDGLALVPSAIGEDAAARLMDAIDAAGDWCPLKHTRDAGRRVAHYGFAYDYATRTVHTHTHKMSRRCPRGCSRRSTLLRRSSRAPLPTRSFFGSERAEFAAASVAGYFNQCIVNEYLPEGVGISPHVDAPVFGPIIACLSLGAAADMVFAPVGADRNTRFALRCEPRSLYVMSGAARSEWRHAMPPLSAAPIVGGDSANTAAVRRISITLRHVPRIPLELPSDAAAVAARRQLWWNAHRSKAGAVVTIVLAAAAVLWAGLA
jgi:alkylated DNA repair dioxygenase AlkB